MFKIVETVEKGKKQLTIVPSKWEKNGTLFWPKMRAEKYIDDAQSKPDNNWLEIKCRVKRTYLLNKDMAEEELGRMLNTVETEQDEVEDTILPKTMTHPGQRKRTIPKQNVYFDQTTNFNDLAESCMANKKTSNFEVQPSPQSLLRTENTQHEYVTISVPQNLDHQFTIPAVINNETIQDSINFLPSLTSGNIDDETKENISRILKYLETLDVILKNQEIILLRVAKLEVIFDEFVKVFGEKKDAVNIAPRKNENLCAEPFEPINNIENLQKLEEKLKDKYTFDEYIEKMSFICGRSKGTHRATDNCYLLIDRFFTRHFMTTCSWAGGCRQSNVEKIPFKIYKNIINLFFQLIYLSDDNFTMLECDLFFKNVIKNATRRNDSSRPTSRQSKAKNRPRKLEYQVKKFQEETEGETEHVNEADDEDQVIENEVEVEDQREENLCNVIVEVGNEDFTLS